MKHEIKFREATDEDMPMRHIKGTVSIYAGAMQMVEEGKRVRIELDGKPVDSIRSTVYQTAKRCGIKLSIIRSADRNAVILVKK